MTDHKDLAFQPTMDEICLPAGELAELSVRAQTQKTFGAAPLDVIKGAERWPWWTSYDCYPMLRLVQPCVAFSTSRSPKIGQPESVQYGYLVAVSIDTAGLRFTLSQQEGKTRQTLAPCSK